MFFFSSELLNTYNFLLLFHSGQVILHPTKDANQLKKLFSDFQGKKVGAV
jgi:hypothetical protein